MRTSKRGGIAAVASTVLLTIGVTGGCGTSVGEHTRAVEDSFVSAEEVTLGAAIAAVYVSPQSIELNDGAPGGYVVLIDSDGTERIFRTEGMDLGQLSWDTSGLFFSDQEYDYRLSSALVRSESPKRESQYDIQATGEGGSIAAYNDGFTDDGYVSQVVEFDGRISTLREVEGYYFATSFCDGTLYGIGQPSGPYAQTVEKRGGALQGESGFTAVMLSRLSATSSGREEVVAIVDTVDSFTTGEDVPCAEGVIRTIGSRYTSDGEVPILRSWNITTGELADVDLVDADGRALTELVLPDLGFWARMSSEAYREGRVDWVTQKGTVFSTDAATGVTEQLLQIEPAPDPAEDEVSIQFDEETLTAVVWQQEEGEALLVSYDRETGKVTRRIALPVLGGLLEVDWVLNVLRDLAVAPEHASS